MAFDSEECVGTNVLVCLYHHGRHFMQKPFFAEVPTSIKFQETQSTLIGYIVSLASLVFVNDRRA